LRLSFVVAGVLLVGTMVLAGAALWASRRVNAWRMDVGALAVAGFLGLVMVGPIQSIEQNMATDIRPDVARLRQMIGDKTLVSYGETAHLFQYYYRRHIPIVPFPKGVDDPKSKVEYFSYCGGSEGIADRKLPFAWEKVGEYCCDRIRSNRPKVLIVVGRRLPQGSAASSEPGAP